MFDRREFLHRSVLGAVSAGAIGGFAVPVAAQSMDSLRIFVPANPGGGWDQTARTIEHVLKAANMVKTVQVTNVGGAGGTVGLPQFINQWKGQGNALMVGGMVMVGAIITAKSPLRLSQTTPIARLTGEFEVIVVPANSPHKDMKSLVAALKADPGKVSWAGGSAGGTDHILVGMVARGGRRADQDVLCRIRRRRPGPGGNPRRPGNGRRQRLGRILRAGQGGQDARARAVVR